MIDILTIHGPNLNLLGQREPEQYGTQTLDELNTQLIAQASALGHELLCFQSNAEHALVERIHQALDQKVKIILMNPAAFTHYSIALRDAIVAVKIPFIEVHISHIDRRESFRKISLFSDVAMGTITGFGVHGYLLAMQAAHHYLMQHDSTRST